MSFPRLLIVLALLCSTASFAQDGAHMTGGAAQDSSGVYTIPYEEYVPSKDHVIADSVDLSLWFPPAGDQRTQASCSGWALGYGLATYFWNKRFNVQPGKTQQIDAANTFSPAFVYNLTARREKVTDCKVGVQLSEAIQLVCDSGVCTWTKFPYDTTVTECIRPVPDTAYHNAQLHRMSSPIQIDHRDFDQWKFHLSKQEPIVFVASVGKFFENGGDATHGEAPFVWAENWPGVDTKQWDPPTRYGHIMVCVGYTSDHKFIALNSWGPKWGNKGYALIPDSTMSWACSEAYVIQPGAPPVAPVPIEKKREIDLGRDQRVKGKLKLGEIHSTDGLVLRFMGPSANGQREMIDLWDINAPDHIMSISVLRGQPTTFHFKGDVYTFNYTGRARVSGQVRYTLVKEDPKDNPLQRRVDMLSAPRVPYAEPKP